MIKKKRTILVIATLSLGVIYFYPRFFEKNSVAGPTAGGLAGSHSGDQATHRPHVDSQPQPIVVASAEAESADDVGAVIPPSVSQIRQEIAENPHETPPSLLEFSAQLAPKMEAAFRSEESAIALFEELQVCGLNSEFPITIQTVCLSNAQVLAETYPRFETQFRALKEQANSEAVRLLGP